MSDEPIPDAPAQTAGSTPDPPKPKPTNSPGLPEGVYSGKEQPTQPES